jgi:xanthine dehydrogenase accessory factor
MRLWSKIVEYLQRERRLALVTIVETRGSTPRESGARMLVLPGGAFFGTIGGGALEWQAQGAAQLALARGEGGEVRDVLLGPELGQCCGGRVKIAIEVLDIADLDLARSLAAAEDRGAIFTWSRPTATGRWERRTATPSEAALLAGALVGWTAGGALLQCFQDARTPFFLFGAGHVGRALVLALAPLPFQVTWIDPRPGAFPAHVLGSVAVLELPNPAEALDAAPAGAMISVMTHSHALDLDIVAAALAARRFPYVGLIGSATKRARFISRLSELGLGDLAKRHLVCPIGVTTIRSKLPAAIAAGIAADVLVRRERLSALPAAVEQSVNG